MLSHQLSIVYSEEIYKPCKQVMDDDGWTAVLWLFVVEVHVTFPCTPLIG